MLVEGQEEMGFVAMAFVAQLEDIVRDGRHGPVVRADDTLVVIGKGLSANLGEEAHGQPVLGPG